MPRRAVARAPREGPPRRPSTQDRDRRRAPGARALRGRGRVESPRWGCRNSECSEEAERCPRVERIERDACLPPAGGGHRVVARCGASGESLEQARVRSGPFGALGLYPLVEVSGAGDVEAVEERADVQRCRRSASPAASAAAWSVISLPSASTFRRRVATPTKRSSLWSSRRRAHSAASRS